MTRTNRTLAASDRCMITSGVTTGLLVSAFLFANLASAVGQEQTSLQDPIEWGESTGIKSENVLGWIDDYLAKENVSELTSVFVVSKDGRTFDFVPFPAAPGINFQIPGNRLQIPHATEKPDGTIGVDWRTDWTNLPRLEWEASPGTVLTCGPKIGGSRNCTQR